MKKSASAIVFYCLMFAGIGSPECVTVEGAQDSPAHIRVAVALGGKTVPGAKVEFYPKGKTHAAFAAITDDQGIVVTPKLAVGEYSVVASLDTEIQTSLELRVVTKRGQKTLLMELGGPYAAAHPQMQLTSESAAEQEIQQRVPAFQGMVLDVAGAAVSTAKIRVLKMGVSPKDFMLAVSPDDNGNFGAQLPEGRYIAYIFANGFRTVRLPFGITKTGSGSLQVALKPGSC
jgi:hypothetical protein